MFDLEQSLAEWREQMLTAGIKSPVPLEELETHLRDEIEQLVGSGVGEGRAFEIAVQRVGQAAPLRAEFAKATGTKGFVFRNLKALIFGAVEVSFPALEDFAPNARQVLELAPAEARRFHHDFIGTEHVLLGLIQSGSEIVSKVMQRLGLENEAIRGEIEQFVGRGAAQEAAVNIPFTPRARMALQLAAGEARALNLTCIRAEHIFLGLMLEGGGVAAQVLKRRGIHAAQAREEILRVMRTNLDSA